MTPSNVQTKSVIFLGVRVEPNTAYGDDKDDSTEFEWAGVNIGVVSKFDKSSATEYVVFLRIAVDNEEGKQAPYSLDVSVVGRFEFVGNDDESKREDLVVVNGLSILYGTLREMVTAISSRMPFGDVCLPGANFMDHRPSLKKAKKEGATAPAKTSAPKKRVPKKSPSAS